MFQFGPRKQQKKSTRNLRKKKMVKKIEDDTIRDISSLIYSSTDRQMSTLFSPSDSYQQMVERDEEYQALDGPKDSYELMPLFSPSERKEDNYQTLSPMPKDSLELLSRKTVTFRSDNWRLEQLEEEVRRLRAIVGEQAKLLRKARKQVDQLIVDYSNQKQPSLPKMVHHFVSEPVLGGKELFSGPKKHHTC